jgi:hypothetical protein
MVFSIALHTTLFVRVYTDDFTGGLTSVYRHRGLNSRPTLAMFILIIFSFTLATLSWATWMAGAAIEIRLALVENVGMELSEKRVLTNAATAKLSLIQQLSGTVMVS